MTLLGLIFKLGVAGILALCGLLSFHAVLLRDYPGHTIFDSCATMFFWATSMMLAITPLEIL